MNGDDVGDKRRCHHCHGPCGASHLGRRTAEQGSAETGIDSPQEASQSTARGIVRAQYGKSRHPEGQGEGKGDNRSCDPPVNITPQGGFFQLIGLVIFGHPVFLIYTKREIVPSLH